MEGYYSISEAADKLEMNYHALIQRIHRHQVKVERVGSNTLIPKDEVARLKKVWGKTTC